MATNTNMSEKTWHQNQNPFDNASCCSMLTFRYFSALMAHGRKNELDPKDIPPPHQGNSSSDIHKAFDAAYTIEVQRWKQLKRNNSRGCCCTRPKYPSIVRTILRAHGRNLIIGNLWCVLWAFFSLVTPFAVRVLLKNIAAGGTEDNAFLGISNPWWLATVGLNLFREP